MGTSLKTQTSLKKYGVVASAGGAAALFITGHWIFGILFLGLAVYLGISLMKFMAGKGQRF